MKKVSKRILIIPEGWCEYNYAQALKASLEKSKQRGVTVEMPKPNYENKALQLFDKAEKLSQKAKQDKNPYDSIWIFFDHDNQTIKSSLLSLSQKSNLKLAYSRICIEQWFLLHLENSRQVFATGKKVMDKLHQVWQKEFSKPYQKVKINHFKQLVSHLPEAVRRASLIEKQMENDGIHFFERNPYFTIHHLIAYFHSL